MPINFKKQIVEPPKELRISPYEPITKEEQCNLIERYRKSDQYKFKYRRQEKRK